MFTRNTSSWEKFNLSDDDVQKFKIKVNDIDRFKPILKFLFNCMNVSPLYFFLKNVHAIEKKLPNRINMLLLFVLKLKRNFQTGLICCYYLFLFSPLCL